MGKRRNRFQKLKDFVSFPLRAFTLFNDDRWGFASLASERYDYVAREVTGYCLDVGCGRHNRFIQEYLDSQGKGIDIYPYDGLQEDNLVDDLTSFPFKDASFNSVTFIANINHIPKRDRNAELGAAYRILKPGGNIIVTMGNPLAEIVVHQVVWLYDKIFKTKIDMDSERGMDEEEAYYLLDSEIVERLQLAGFKRIAKKYFLTQWCLNHLFVGWKIPEERSNELESEKSAAGGLTEKS